MKENPTPTFDEHMQNVDDQANAALKAIQELKQQEKAVLGSIPEWTQLAIMSSAASWALLIPGSCGFIIPPALCVFLIIPFTSLFGAFSALRVLAAKQLELTVPYRKKAVIALILAVIPLAGIGFLVFISLISGIWNTLWQR